VKPNNLKKQEFWSHRDINDLFLLKGNHSDQGGKPEAA